MLETIAEFKNEWEKTAKCIWENNLWVPNFQKTDTKLND